MQVGFMVDNQIKRARAEAEQNFKVELAKLKRELTTLQQFTEKQGSVIATVSKDLANARTEVARAGNTINGCKIHCSQQQQLMHTIQLALGNVVKELEDVDKRLAIVGSGEEYAAAGYGEEYRSEAFSMMQDPLAALANSGRSPEAAALGQKAAAAVAKVAGKKESKQLDAGAQEFVPALPTGAATDTSPVLDALAPEFVPGGVVPPAPPPGIEK
jgi:hypothetical protein